MSQPLNQLYEFGTYRLDGAERVLWRGDELIVLPPKVFDTLWMLVRKEGRVVTKSELMAAVWADAFVEESNLSQNIYTLRRTLGVDEEGRQFIETVPRRGYRFAVPVKLLGQSAGVAAKQVEADVAAMTTADGVESLGTDSKTLPVPQSAGDSEEREPAAIPVAEPEADTFPSRSGLRYTAYAGVGVLLLAALVLGVFQFVIRPGRKSQPPVAPIEQLRLQRLTDSGDVDSPTISPDRELLAYVRLGEEEESVWVKQIATGTLFQTLPPSRKGYRSLAFSLDGKYLFFRDGPNPGTIYQSPRYGGTPRKVADNVWSDFSVSPDGKQVAFIRREVTRDIRFLTLSNTDGSGERELITNETKLAYRSNAPAWSPDGARVVVATGSGRLLAISAATGEETELKAPRWRAIFNTLWMPDGQHLIVSAREGNETVSQLWMIGYPDGDFRRLTNDLESYLWVSISSDGRQLVARQRKIVQHLSLVSGDGKKARQLTFGERGLDGQGGLVWTPDGRIVFSSFADNVTDLHVMKPDGTNRVQLTTNVGKDNAYPAVSNDGRYIVFESNRTGARQIWRMDIDGRNQKQLTFSEDQRERSQDAALSPDGAQVYFIKYGQGAGTIWKVPIDGGTPVPVSQLPDAATETLLSISPDGKWLAYQHASVQSEARNEEKTMRIRLLPTHSGVDPKLFDLPIRRPIIQWSADSASFFYAAGTVNSSSLWQQRLDGGKPQKLLDFPDRVFNFAWSPDRKNLVVSSGQEIGDAILITNLP
ncbi:MAG TPA: winged helix-turn-helix domain-containing protein [Blastocatellia bacterium]|nr:winged helix-turn-helix domain-containing protein [Blastocatellia bacterium]